MQVSAPDANLGVVLGEVLRHPLGEGRDEHSLVGLRTPSNFMEQIVDLPAYRPHFDFRIGQTCRPNHLLDHNPSAFRQFVRTRCCRNIDELIRPFLEFFER